MEMNRHWGLIVIAVSLIGLAVLVFAFPARMIAPGAVIPAHARIADDCFACHAPLRGASAERCVACHKLADIGIRTTAGVSIRRSKSTVAFHQSLAQQDCMACHSDHAGPRLVGHAHKPFAHSFLKPQVQRQCESCHAIPQATFHQSLKKDCARCHTVTGWTPTTFNHDRFFRLSGDHDAPCATCHVESNFTRYTCFGCHEHRRAAVLAEHAQEGIRNIENCVRCHRSSDEREGGGEGSGED